MMKHMGSDGDAEIVKKVEIIYKDLSEKEEEFSDLDKFNQTLILRERRTNDELQEARKELVNVCIKVLFFSIISKTLRMLEMSPKSWFISFITFVDYERMENKYRCQENGRARDKTIHGCTAAEVLSARC